MNNIKNKLLNHHNITILSHVDMDGFASQHIVKQFIRRNNDSIEIKLLNIQYGEEPDFNSSLTNALIVTDLHFDEKQYLRYQKIFEHVYWIDHHPSKDYSKYENNKNIEINTTMSATKLCSEIFNTMTNEPDINEINAADIFQKHNIDYFNQGRETSFLLNQLLDLFYEDDRDEVGRIFVLFLFRKDKYTAYLSTIKYMLDEHKLTLTQINTGKLLIKVLQEPVLLGNNYIVVNTSNISDIADLWFSQNTGRKLMVGINFEKNSISFRSTNKTARLIAESLNGGGHDNAAGAKLDNRLTKDEVVEAIKHAIKKTLN